MLSVPEKQGTGTRKGFLVFMGDIARRERAFSANG
jgi:hypothetical protein